MANGKRGAFGSRKGIKTPAVMVQGNQLRVAKDPAPWFADFDSLAAQCTALTTSPAMILQYFGDADLMAKVERNGLNDATKALNEQIKQQKDRLAGLVAETKAMREGAPAEGDKSARAPITKITQDNTVELLNHGEQFQTFMDDWLRIIYFSMDKVLQYFRDVGAEIPLLCPYSQGYVKSEGGMDAAELKAAANVSLDEIAAEATEEQRIGDLIRGVMTAGGGLKMKYQRGLRKLLGLTKAQFDSLYSGDYRQFNLAQLTKFQETLGLADFEERVAAAEDAAIEEHFAAQAEEPTLQKSE